MKQTWRWFGPKDSVTLSEVRQAGAEGIVTALHHLPNGSVWPVEEIQASKARIEDAGLDWDVVESIPIHEDIKTGAAGWQRYADAWAQSLRNLGACGIRTVCYNFMPVLDWTRTNLSYPLPNGAHCLRFDAVDFAVFDIHILGRAGARDDHHPDIVAQTERRFEAMDQDACQALTGTILAGLPGSEESYTLDQFRSHLARYDGIDAAKLRQNLANFLRHVLPAAEEAGVVLAIHPDDPPRPLFGLPRIVSTVEDMRFIAEISDSTSNGFTFCTGSYGVRADNDLPAMLREHAGRVHFLHLRATRREQDGLSFHEAEHLNGDVDMVDIIRVALEAERARGVTLPFRPDHGHELLDDHRRPGGAPGYPAIGRLRGLAEIRGVMHAVARFI